MPNPYFLVVALLQITNYATLLQLSREFYPLMIDATFGKNIHVYGT